MLLLPLPPPPTPRHAPHRYPTTTFTVSADSVKPVGKWAGVQMPSGCQQLNLTSPSMATQVVVSSAACALNIESAPASNVTFTGPPGGYAGHQLVVSGEAQLVQVAVEATAVAVTSAAVHASCCASSRSGSGSDEGDGSEGGFELAMTP